MGNTALVSTKFYHFSQNNSGGSFTFDEAAGITHNVIVEATDYQHANMLAERIGLYFDGDGDCPCCGDRWYSQSSYSDGYDVPSIYGEPVSTGVNTVAWMPLGKETVVHYLGGRKEWYGVATKASPPRVKKVKK
jgi:hypothetical protein